MMHSLFSCVVCLAPPAAAGDIEVTPQGRDGVSDAVMLSHMLSLTRKACRVCINRVSCVGPQLVRDSIPDE